MHIAFIHPRYPNSEGTGATHTATQVVTGLAERGHDIVVYCARNPPDKDFSGNLELRLLSGKSKHPHTSTRLAQEVRARQNELQEFDIVHSYLPRLIPAIAELAQTSNLGTVVTLNAYGGICARNDLLYTGSKQCAKKSIQKCFGCIVQSAKGDYTISRLYDGLSKLFNLKLITKGEPDHRHVDAFRAPSQHVKKHYIQFGYEDSAINIIPHPIDNNFFISHNSDFCDPYRLLYVGALDSHKGVQKLPRILERLEDSSHKFRLTIVGSGEKEDYLFDEISKRNLQDIIDFAGFIPNADLPEVYSKHDLFIYPGIWDEPLARVFLESLATGTPIVSTEFGSIRDILNGGGVTTDGSIGGFCEKILDLVENDKLYSLSIDGKRKAEDYKLKNILPKIEEMYREVCTADEIHSIN